MAPRRLALASVALLSGSRGCSALGLAQAFQPVSEDADASALVQREVIAYASTHVHAPTVAALTAPAADVTDAGGHAEATGSSKRRHALSIEGHGAAIDRRAGVGGLAGHLGSDSKGSASEGFEGERIPPGSEKKLAWLKSLHKKTDKAKAQTEFAEYLVKMGEARAHLETKATTCRANVSEAAEMFMVMDKVTSKDRLVPVVAKFFGDANLLLTNHLADARAVGDKLAQAMPDTLRANLVNFANFNTLTGLVPRLTPLEFNETLLASTTSWEACGEISRFLSEVQAYGNLSQQAHASANTTAKSKSTFTAAMYHLTEQVDSFVVALSQLGEAGTSAVEHASHEIINTAGPIVERRLGCTGWRSAASAMANVGMNMVLAVAVATLSAGRLLN